MTKQEHFFNDYRKQITRRWFCKECGVGLGAIALSSLLSETSVSAAGKITGVNPFPSAALPNPTPFNDGAVFNDPYLKNAYSLQWNFGVERAVRARYRLEHRR